MHLAGGPPTAAAFQAFQQTAPGIPQSARDRFSHCFIKSYLNLSTSAKLKGQAENEGIT